MQRCFDLRRKLAFQRRDPIFIYGRLNVRDDFIVELRFEQMAEAPLTI